MLHGRNGLEEKVCEHEFTMEIELRDSFEVRNVLPEPREAIAGRSWHQATCARNHN